MADSDDDRDPDRVPTQAELDAEDLAELARTSQDSDRARLYPARAVDPGPPPLALIRDARIAWYGAAVAALISVIYGFLNLGMITDLLRQRLAEGVVNDPKNASPANQVDSLASFFPPFMLIMILVFLAIEYLLLNAIANHHSREIRAFFLATIVVNLLCIPVGIDLLFRYPDVWASLPIIGWVQFACLVVAAVCTLRRSVGKWLPASTRMRPMRMFRGS